MRSPRRTTTARRRSATAARPASTRRSASPTRTPRWRPTGATGGSSRPTSSTRWSTTPSAWSSTSRSRPARSTRARSCSRASTPPPQTTGAPIRTVTADAGYAYAKVYGGLERREIEAVIPAKAEPIRSPVPLRRFRYDARHDIVKCPRGKILRPTRPVKHGRFFYSRAVDCKALRPRRALPLQGAREQGGRGRRRLPGAAARPSTARAVDAMRTAGSTSAIAGDRRATTARRRPGTASPAPSGAASRTCASRPS